MASGPSSHLRSFQELVQQRVQRVLLVSTLYDSFILSEEGRLQETLLSQFIDLNLLNVPDITRVASGQAALERVERSGQFDLVISSVNAGRVDPVELKLQLEEKGVYLPVLALAYSSRDLAEFMQRNDTSILDGVFLWQGDARIFLAMVKCVEDKLNVAHDTGRMGVPAIIVAEDNVRFLSSFLPSIYSEIYRHTRWLLSEDLNLSQKLLRMRARPKVLLSRTFEEAWSYFSAYEPQILGLISDFEFPRGGVLDRSAGIELTRRVHAARPDIRLVLQSSLPANKALADDLGASFILKGSPVLLHDLRKILVERFGFGDFVFRMPGHGEVDRAHDLKSLLEKLETVPDACIAYHAERNHFSNWLKARTEFALADRLRPRQVADFATTAELRALLLREIGGHRRDRNRVVVADFNRSTFDPGTSITRIGRGSLGGKARGIAFANHLIERVGIDRAFPDVDIVVPTSLVVSTEVFDEFLEGHGLDDYALACDREDEILGRFLAEPLPRHIVEDLRAFLRKASFPLAVRSSSLLEDSFAQPFAGIYRTFMLPNDHPNLEVRVAQLVEAVKRVYASMFTDVARSYLGMTPFRLEEEKMAVLIQRLVGRRHGARHYPDFAGVARSYNYYPQPPHRPEDGVAAVALGMGRTVVDGAPCLRFCPRHPKQLLALASPQDAVRSSQRSFYALELGMRSSSEIGDLRSYPLGVAERDGSLRFVASTYLPEDDRVVPGVSRKGVRLVTFAPILEHGAFPLAEVLARLLDDGSEGTNGPVEIEFAGTLARRKGERSEFAFLQMRPLAPAMEADDVQIEDFAPGRVLCRSTQVLGNGRIDDIRDIVVVDAKCFDRHRSVEVAAHVADANRVLQAERRPYLLIGVGRWGSADPFLGIPVTWNQIAGARVIVEAGLLDLRVEPSQGTHFFQNLTSSQVGYFTVNPDIGEGSIDWDWLAAAPAVSQHDCVRHLRFAEPLLVKIDGRSREGVILKPRHSTAVS